MHTQKWKLSGCTHLEPGIVALDLAFRSDDHRHSGRRRRHEFGRELNVVLFGAKVPHVLVVGGRLEFAHKRLAVLDLGRRLELGIVDLGTKPKASVFAEIKKQ